MTIPGWKAADSIVGGLTSASQQDMRSLFGQSNAIFLSLAGPTHTVETANPAFFTAIGPSDGAVGIPLADLIPAWVDEGVIARLDDVYHSGEPTAGHDIQIATGTGEHACRSFFDLSYEPRREADDSVIGVRLIGVETTQLRHAQRLMIEQRALVEQIARQAPLADVLDGMARTIEDLAPEQLLVSVLLADPDGAHLRHGAAPSLPNFYNEAIDGIATGEGVGSCGTAAHRREPVIVTDIGTDPFWVDFRDLAQRAGLAACWSTPILARDRNLLGTFAMYHRTPRVPQDTDLALARVFADTASLAIERHHSDQAKAAAEAQAETAREELAIALRSEHQLRAEAEQRAEAAAELATQMRSAAAAHEAAPHPEHCQLGGHRGCGAAAEIKVADSWGDAAWGCPEHVEQALMNVRSVFIADEQLGGLASYLRR